MKNKSKFSLSLRPGFLRTLVVVIGVVFVWRGLWNFIDLYLFPNDPFLSNLISILLGLILLYLPDEDVKELL